MNSGELFYVLLSTATVLFLLKKKETRRSLGKNKRRATKNRGKAKGFSKRNTRGEQVTRLSSKRDDGENK